MEYEPMLALFQEFGPFFEARIWIRIHIKVKNPDLDPHPDPHQIINQNPDPHQGMSQIWIRIKVM